LTVIPFPSPPEEPDFSDLIAEVQRIDRTFQTPDFSPEIG
jgi:hypothetical protein